ncbi:MAG: hypothetical protein H6607_09675 [Flavobacteriales bacterium]|nr:hypothetical protein [Flavobacteriales bacterium]
MIFSAHPLMLVGKINKTHSYEGLLRVEFIEEIDFKEPLFLLINQKPVPFFIESISGSNPYVVKFYDVNTFEEAQLIQGQQLFMTGTEDQNEALFVEGYAVVDVEKGKIGIIEEVIENPAHPILKLEYQSKECLIPLVEEFIHSFDHKSKILTMNLPEGLLDL